jgi:hypothetical protein
MAVFPASRLAELTPREVPRQSQTKAEIKSENGNSTDSWPKTEPVGKRAQFDASGSSRWPGMGGPEGPLEESS